MALALAAGVSAEVSCALALATDGGIVGELSPPSCDAASSVVAAFLSEDFSSTLLDLRCAGCEPCLALTPTDDPAVSDFELAAAFSAPAAASDGPAKHTKRPVVSIKPKPPLAFALLWHLPL